PGVLETRLGGRRPTDQEEFEVGIGRQQRPHQVHRIVANPALRARERAGIERNPHTTSFPCNGYTFPSGPQRLAGGAKPLTGGRSHTPRTRPVSHARTRIPRCYRAHARSTLCTSVHRLALPAPRDAPGRSTVPRGRS